MSESGALQILKEVCGAYHLGHYLKVFDIVRTCDQQVLEKCGIEVEVEVKWLMARALVELGDKVTADLQQQVDSDSTAHQLLNILNTFTPYIHPHSPVYPLSQVQQILDQLHQQCNQYPSIIRLLELQIAGHSMHLQLLEPLLHSPSPSTLNQLELQLERVTIYLRLNRRDLSGKEVEQMCQIDDEHPVSVLAKVYHLMAIEDYKGALGLVEELKESWYDSGVLANLRGVCLVQIGHLPQALSTLSRLHSTMSTNQTFYSPLQMAICLHNLTHLHSTHLSQLNHLHPHNSIQQLHTQAQHIFDQIQL